MTPPVCRWREECASGDEGYLLLGLVVACFLILLALGVAAPRVAKQLERDREVESEHRAQEYVHAIHLYYHKRRRFPSSVEELLGTGTSGLSSALNEKYLRQQYKDPLTGGDYRLILVGKAKTEVKGFFGEPLEGMPVGNLGSVAGMQSNPAGGAASAFGGSTPGAAAGTSGLSFGSSSTFGSAQNSSSGTQNANSGGTTATSSSTGTGSGAMGSTTGSSTDATTFQGSKGAFLGVGSNAKGHGLVEWNGSENIEEWEFLYDPRVEVLKAKVSMFGGAPAAGGVGSTGASQGVAGSSIFGGTNGSSTGNSSGFGSQSGAAGTSAPASTATPGSSPATPTIP